MLDTEMKAIDVKELKDYREKIRLANDSIFNEFGRNAINGLTKLTFNKDKQVFWDGEDRKGGLMTNCYGLTSMLGVYNFINILPSDSEKEIIIKTLDSIINEVQGPKGYNLMPYLPSDLDLTNKIPIKSLSAVIIALVFSYRLHIGKKITFNEVMLKKMAIVLKEAFQALENVIMEDEVLIGWGFLVGIKEADLASTYLVVEAYSRFQDACLKKKDEDKDKDAKEKNEQNIRFVEMIGKELVGRLTNNVRQVAYNIYKKYEKVYGNNLFLESGEVFDEGQLKSISRTSILFYPLYVAMITLMGYTDETLAMEKLKSEGHTGDVLQTYQKLAKENQLSEAVKDIVLNFQNKTSDAIHYVQAIFRVLNSDSRGHIADIDYGIYSTQNTEVIDKTNLSKLNKANIEIAHLRPLILSAKSMIVYGLIKYPQQEMSKLYDEILKSNYKSNQSQKQQYLAWSEDGLNLFATERNITAITYDYIYYFEKFEMFFRAFSSQDDDLKKILDNRIGEAEKAAELQQQSIIASLKSEYIQLKEKSEKNLKDLEAAKDAEIAAKVKEEIERNKRNNSLILEVKKAAKEAVDERIKEIFDDLRVYSVQGKIEQNLINQIKSMPQPSSSISDMDQLIIDTKNAAASVERRAIEASDDGFYAKENNFINMMIDNFTQTLITVIVNRHLKDKDWKVTSINMSHDISNFIKCWINDLLLTDKFRLSNMFSDANIIETNFTNRKGGQN